MNGPFTRDASKLDSVAQAVVENWKSRPNKAQAKQKWMGEFEHHVVSQYPKHAGKIDWDTAHHFHNLGKGSKEAADQYVRGREREEETEQLDELSKKTLKSYKKQALGRSFDRLQRDADSSWIRADYKGSDKAHLKMKNRAKGHTLATKKISEK